MEIILAGIKLLQFLSQVIQLILRVHKWLNWSYTVKIITIKSSTTSVIVQHFRQPLKNIHYFFELIYSKINIVLYIIFYFKLSQISYSLCPIKLILYTQLIIYNINLIQFIFRISNTATLRICYIYVTFILKCLNTFIQYLGFNIPVKTYVV